MLDPTYRLEGIVKDKNGESDFEGPLSLILMLLSKNKIEIRDINISDILEQYTAYLEQMESMDLEIASEFVQMASHLLYIKTKMLLNLQDEEVSELEQLITSLEQLQCKTVLSQIQAVVPVLGTMSEQGGRMFARYPERLPQMPRTTYEYHHDPADLIASLLLVFSRERATVPTDILRTIAPKRIIRSVKQKSRDILLRLREQGPTSLLDLLAACEDRSDLITAFLSVLELCSVGSVEVDYVKDGYIVSFVGGDVEKILESISDEESNQAR